MPYPQFDRFKLKIKPLSERLNKIFIEKNYIPINSEVRNFNRRDMNILEETLNRIRDARGNGKPVILTFGAHSIKNALAKVFIKLMEDGWITHLATNGAGIIHDWEFAFQGKTSEDVKANVAKGEFGAWNETGYNINLAIVVGAYEGLGYGESVGKMILNESLSIPSIYELKEVIKNSCEENPDKAAAACDLIYTIQKFNLESGMLIISHPFKEYSVQAAAYRMNIPFTGHPMIGHDIIYTHPMNNGPAVGRTALRDFLTFAEQVNNLEGGVYLSVGSAVMSPMIFEKSLSMAQNIAIQNKKHIDKHYMLIVDLAENNWNWEDDGEPPMDNPAYYLRYYKTFSRMGGKMKYLCADNRDLLLFLTQNL